MPAEPGGSFPAHVLDEGAFPALPYDFAFWGFPCIKFSGLNRAVTDPDLVASLTLLLSALSLLGENPPKVFVLENTACLVSGPAWVLDRITTALQSLPYHWRCAALPLLSPPLRPPCRPPPPP